MKLEIFKKKVKVFKKGGFHTNPDIAWEIVIYIAIALVVGIFVYGVFLFKDLDNGFSIPEENLNEQSKIVNETRINKVLEYFSIRAEKTDQILSTPTPFVDPSL